MSLESKWLEDVITLAATRSLSPADAAGYEEWRAGRVPGFAAGSGVRIGEVRQA